MLAVAGILALSNGIAAAAPSASRVLISFNRTEPDIAIDPGNPSTIVVGTNPNYNQVVNGVQPDGLFVSHNGGKSFSNAFLPAPSGFTEYADPSVSIARSGTMFFGYLAETPSYCSEAGRSAVLVSASTNGGATFRTPAIVSVSSANDKPFLGVQSVPGHRAHVFISWTQFTGNTSTVLVARSTNGGLTFGAPKKLYTSAYDNSGSLPLVGPHGRIYVIWAAAADRGLSRTNPAKVLFRVSSDDGVQYGPVRQAGPGFTSLPRMANPMELRNLTLPAATVAPNGTVYIAWSQVSRDYGNGAVSSDIVLTRSTNGGRTWASPRRINDSRVGDRFMPAISSYSDGSVGLAFYDRRGGPNDLGVYAARVTWTSTVHVGTNERVNARPSTVAKMYYIKPGSTCLSPGRFFGDYIAAEAAGRQLLVTWADTTGSTNGQTNIWVRRIGLNRP